MHTVGGGEGVPWHVRPGGPIPPGAHTPRRPRPKGRAAGRTLPRLFPARIAWAGGGRRMRQNRCAGRRADALSLGACRAPRGLPWRAAPLVRVPLSRPHAARLGGGARAAGKGRRAAHGLKAPAARPARGAMKNQSYGRCGDEKAFDRAAATCDLPDLRQSRPALGPFSDHIRFIFRAPRRRPCPRCGSTTARRTSSST